MSTYVVKQTEPEWPRWPPPRERLEGRVSDGTIRFRALGVFWEALKHSKGETTLPCHYNGLLLHYQLQGWSIIFRKHVLRIQLMNGSFFLMSAH